MEVREALTIRLPAELANRARVLKDKRESLNEFVVEAVDREVRRRQGVHAFAEILRARTVIQTRRGLLPDSTPLIRDLRSGDARRD